MTNPLDSEDLAHVALQRCVDHLYRMFVLLDDRVDLIEVELDATRDGSLAATVHKLRTELTDLRARLEERA